MALLEQTRLLIAFVICKSSVRVRSYFYVEMKCNLGGIMALCTQSVLHFSLFSKKRLASQIVYLTQKNVELSKMEMTCQRRLLKNTIL